MILPQKQMLVHHRKGEMASVFAIMSQSNNSSENNLTLHRYPSIVTGQSPTDVTQSPRSLQACSPRYRDIHLAHLTPHHEHAGWSSTVLPRCSTANQALGNAPCVHHDQTAVFEAAWCCSGDRCCRARVPGWSLRATNRKCTCSSQPGLVPKCAYSSSIVL